MKWKNIFLIAFRSILKNRMRSLLTSLGIVIGVCSVIVMVAIGEGSQAKVKEQINSLGTNLLIIFPGISHAGGVSRGAGSLNRLSLDDAEKIAEEAKYIDAVSPMVMTGAQVIGGGNNWMTSINGVSIDYPKIRDWELASGEFFTEQDIRSRRKVAVLGKTIADNLFPGQDPIGERIRIRNTPFKVIGVLSEKGQNARGMDEDDLVLAPSTTVLYRLKGRRWVNMIFARAASADQMDAAKKEAENLLRESHRIEPKEEDDFGVRDQTEIIQMATETSRTLTLLLGAVAAVSLIVGGIGIMNIMLVSVTERTREIGIRLSVGARNTDVLVQFLTEAVALSLTGGLIGIMLANCVAFLLNRFTELNPVINPGIVLLSFAFAAVVGIFFGFYPARKASNLNPIDALRYE